MALLWTTSEAQPSNPENGKGWYKPSLGAFYIYINDGWRPFVGGDNLQTIRTPLTIFIRGIERTLSIDHKSYKKTDELTSKADTLTFILDDKDGDIQPTPGEEVIVLKRASDSEVPTLEFGGEIVSAPQREKGPGSQRYLYTVKCLSFEKRLDKENVADSYENTTTQAVIQDMVDNKAKEFSINNVEAGVAVSQIRFNNTGVGRNIKELSRKTGRDFYVDYERDIHHFPSGTGESAAPFTLDDDTGVSGNYRNLIIKVDNKQLRNVIKVQGSTFLSDDYTQEKLADGDQTSFQLDAKPFVTTASGTVEIYKNNVKSTSVGIDNIDDPGSVEWLINQGDEVVKLGTETMTDVDVFKAIYRFEKPVVATARSDASIAALKEIFAGNGIYDYFITDSSIETVESAQDRATAELVYANALITGSFETKDSGYRSGQILTVNMASRGYTARQFVIQKVSSKMLGRGGENITYFITFAIRLLGLDEFLADLFEKDKQLIIREEETVHDIVAPATEVLELTEETPTTEEQTPPYEYGPAGSPQGVYNESQYA